MTVASVLALQSHPVDQLPDGEASSIQLKHVPGHWPPPDDLMADLGFSPLPGDRVDADQAFLRQFAAALAEGLAGVRPVRQLLPWLSSRAAGQFHRLLPVFAAGRQPRVLRVLSASPAADVIEMTLVIAIGPRTRALAVRLEHSVRRQDGANPQHPGARRDKLGAHWICTAIEAA
jgi:hypothetical protein